MALSKKSTPVLKKELKITNPKTGKTLVVSKKPPAPPTRRPITRNLA